jgi:toxin-antitoxin system PIN domain toxin
MLVHAVNRYAPEHARAARVLEELANGSAPWSIAWPSVHGFLSFVTHPHRVARPLRPAEAWAFVDGLRESGSLRLLAPTERHAAIVGDLIASLGSEPGVVTGLETAAVLREHGVRELLSSDRGMRRFAFLSVRDPLHGEAWSPSAAPERRYRRLRSRG